MLARFNGYFLNVFACVFAAYLNFLRTKIFPNSVKMSHSSNQKKKQNDSTQNIKVVVRVRPLQNEERKRRVKEVVHCRSICEIQAKEKKYQFDRVFPPNSSQMDIYSFVVAPMIIDVLSGYNCTVFAYGQTGTGKTHTMTGGDPNSSHLHWKDNELAGCIPRAAANIFEAIGTMKVNDYNVRVSFLELYNEEVRDLLVTEPHSKPLSMFNDSKGSVCIQNLNEITVFSSKDIYKLLEQGTLKRHTAATLMNNHSSRSHTVFTITVHTRETTLSGEEMLKTGKINLVDLAGSENIAKAGAKDKRAQELVNINRSLLTLGRVIQILADKKNQHVPYRESKLTRILQDSLGGHTKTCIIATVSPGHTSFDETQSTLEYACRARVISNTPMVNEKVTKDQMMKKMTSEIDKLKRDLDAARTGIGFFVERSNWEELTSKCRKASDSVIQKNDIIDDMKTRLSELETIRDIKRREYEEAMNVCNHKEKIIEKAKNLLKEQSNSLKRERYLSDRYLEAAMANKSAARELSENVESLSKNQNILQEKLENQYINNAKNERIVNENGSILTDLLSLAMMTVRELGCKVNSNATDQKKNLETAKSTCTYYSTKSKMTWDSEHRPEIETAFVSHANLVQDQLEKIEEGIQKEQERVGKVLGFMGEILDGSNTARAKFVKYDRSKRDYLYNHSTNLSRFLLHSRTKKESQLRDLKKHVESVEDELKGLNQMISYLEEKKDTWTNSIEATEHEDRIHTIVTSIETVNESDHMSCEALERSRDGLKVQSKACCEIKRDLLINNQANKKVIEQIMCNKLNEESSLITTNLEHLNAVEEQMSSLHRSLETSLFNLETALHDAESAQKDIISNFIHLKRTGETPKQECLNYPERLKETTLSRVSLIRQFNEFNEDIDESFHLNDSQESVPLEIKSNELNEESSLLNLNAVPERSQNCNTNLRNPHTRRKKK